MITCPSCKSQAIEGTFFCDNCGAPLVEITHDATDAEDTATPSTRVETPLDSNDATTLEPSATFGLRLVSTGDVISLQGRRRYTLGLALPDQAVVPDVDLSLFGAEQHGVSRIHTELRVKKNVFQAIDLESVNGTSLNGVHLKPLDPVRIQHGDRIQLGTLEFEFLTHTG
ncbi:MAG TPA: FHA domain-containing protein [Anaerolineae bacterium]|nr:FHA domain-containing protein [Anaerolineae bacterium]